VTGSRHPGLPGMLAGPPGYRLHPLLGDAVIALLVTGVALMSMVDRVAQVRLTGETSVRFNEPDLLGVVLVLTATGSLLWRRRAPVLVLAATCVSFVAFHVLEYAPTPLPFAELIALYTVAVLRPFAISATAMGVMVGSIAAVALAYTGQLGPLTEDEFIAYLLTTAFAWLLGYGVRLNRLSASLLEQEAVRLAGEQRQRIQRALEDERARIARELHDIVSHNVSVMVAQAGAAQRAFAREPEAARTALVSIEASGREGLTEMRRLLGVLGSDGEPDTRAPQPGLAHLPALVAAVERSGLPVDLRVQGEARALPAGLELSAYRIVQEALTNTLKHAGPARACAVLEYRSDTLLLSVDDDGRRSAAAVVPGHGLIGMQQRVALLGGRMTYGRGDGGGFHISVALPLRGGTPGPAPRVPEPRQQPVDPPDRGQAPLVGTSREEAPSS
jgi:signal transduction histidine kinase